MIVANEYVMVSAIVISIGGARTIASRRQSMAFISSISIF